MNNSQSKTRGVLAAEEIEVIYARWHCGSAIGLARDIEAAVLAKAASQSPVAPADERAFPGAPVCSVCSTLIGSAPTVSATDAHKAGMLEAIGICLDQVGKAGKNFDREIGVRSCVTAIGEEVKAKYGRPYPIDATPTPPTSAELPGSLDGLVCEHCGEGHTELTFADGQFAINCDNCSADCLHFTVEHLNSVLPPTSAADAVRAALDNLCQSLPDVLPSAALARFEKTGKWAGSDSYGLRGIVGKLEYRADDMATVYSALDAAIAASKETP